VNPAQVFTYLYTFLQRPIEWSLQHLTTAFGDVAALRSIGAFGLAVIVVTLVIRGALFPLFGWQLRTQRRIQAEQRLIAPQMQAIRKKYKKEPQKLQEEMMKLYREHGISPFSSLTGCLPMLVQIPILGSLYFGIRGATDQLHGHSLGFLWISDVSKTPHDLGGLGYILPVLAALATAMQSRMMMQPPRPDMSDQERQMYNISKNMVFLAPAMVLMIGINLSQGVALYWVTQSIFMIVQQWYVVGWGGLKVPSWFPGAGRVTPLSFSQPPQMALARREAKGTPEARGPRRPAQPQVADGRVPQRPRPRPRPRVSSRGGGARRRRGR